MELDFIEIPRSGKAINIAGTDGVKTFLVTRGGPSRRLALPFDPARGHQQDPLSNFQPGITMKICRVAVPKRRSAVGRAEARFTMR